MEILELLKGNKFKEVIKYAEDKKKKPAIEHDVLMNQYNVDDHDVFDEVKRPNKQVLIPKTDEEGNAVVDANKKEVFTKGVEFVARVGMPYQQLIVDRRAGFLLSNPVRIYTSQWEGESKVKEIVEIIWHDNKLDYRNQDIAIKLMSECEVAELWYIKQDNEFWKNKSAGIQESISSPARPKMMVLSKENGDGLFPIFDKFKDLIAFVRTYTGLDETGKDIKLADIYTDEVIYKLQEKSGEWLPASEEPIKKNDFGKIPVIYYYQKFPEWHNVQSMIDRRETVLSNVGDENDYFGKPILFFTGKIIGMSKKSDSGKVMSGETGSDAKFISWEHAPESLKLELDQLDEGIYKFSQTADISFQSIKGIGNITGVVMKFLFADSHMAARKKEIIIGEAFQRRINLLKHLVGEVIHTKVSQEAKEIELSPIFTPFTPENIKEEVEVLVTAYEGGILSHESAIDQNPLVDNAEDEMNKILDERGVGESPTGGNPEAFNL